MTDDPQRRRSSDRQLAEFDKRLALLEERVQQIAASSSSMHTKLDAIRNDMAEPQASPLGRSLLERAIKNAAAIELLQGEVKSLNASRSEMIGAAKFSRLVQLALGIAIAVITLVQVVERSGT